MATHEDGDQKVDYSLLDIAQCISSLLVILIHCGRLSSNPYVHFFVKSMLGRLAVPFFLVCSGYFYRERTKESADYAEKYYRRHISQYMKWSILYLPFGLLFLYRSSLSWFLYPVGLLVGVIYSGVWYHLWYIPALLTGVWFAEKAVKKTNYVVAFVLFGFLFALGATETYSAYIDGTRLGEVYTIYRSLFYTTRNGLLFSPIFILSGFLFSDYKHASIFQKSLKMKLLLCSLLLMVEGIFIFQKQGHDKNFLFSAIPFVLFLCAFLINQSTKKMHHPRPFLRMINKYLYFLHPLFLEITTFIATLSGIQKFEGMPLFFVTLASTMLCIFLMYRWKQTPTLHALKKKSMMIVE